MNRLKLLVATRFLPLRDAHGGCTYLADCLAGMRGQGWEIECAWLTERPGGTRRVWRVPEAVQSLARLVCPGNVSLGSWRFAWRGLKQAALECFGRKKDRVQPPPPDAAGGVVTPQVQSTSDRLPEAFEHAFIQRRLRTFRPDVLMADFTFMAPLLPENSDGESVRVILTHDVLHERLASFRDFGLSTAWAEWPPEKEAALLRRADLLIAISEPEAETFRRLCPELPVVVAPMSAGAEKPRVKLPVPVIGRCLFVGGKDAHNVHGLRWCLDEVWPLVRAQVPEATLEVCGSVCEAFSGEWPGVTLAGRVPDLQPHYEQAAVCVVPILAGSGIKIKLVEALTQGRACVTTPAGLRGLETLSEGVRIAESPADFARAIAALLQDEIARRQLAQAGAQLVAQRLSPEACYGPVSRAMEQLVQARAAGAISPGPAVAGTVGGDSPTTANS